MGTQIDIGLADRDLDTGRPVVPGGYPLTDRTYVGGAYAGDCGLFRRSGGAYFN